MVEESTTAQTPTRSRLGGAPRQRRGELPAGGAGSDVVDRTARTDPTEVDRTPAVCQWTCPVCENTRGSLLTDGRTEAHVLNDLRSHLRAAGDAHGSPGELPPALDRESLGRYVGRNRASATDTHGDD